MNDTNFLKDLCTWDIERYSNVLKAYCGINEDIMCQWYNDQSWYIYIALENWITICEAFNWIEYLVTDYEDWEEHFFDTYKEAEEKQDFLNK